MGVTDLLAAYVRILGHRVAYAAVVGNKQMLTNVNSVEEINAIVAAIHALAGPDGGSRILYREPSVLYGSPEGVMDSIAALEETLGHKAAAFALSRNPALLQGGRAVHIRVAMQTLQDVLGGDGVLAAKLVNKNTLLLGTNGETVRQSFDALCAMFGGSTAAIALIKRNSGLLRTRPNTLYEALDALAEILGDAEAAADAVSVNRTLLKARPETLRGAFAALVAVYGSVEAARAVARMQLGVLRSLPKTIVAAYEALRELFGEETAHSMIEMTPGLLQIRAAALRYNFAHFKSFLGSERAADMAESMPHVIKMRVGRAAEVTAAMVEVYGGSEAAAANVYPPTYRLTGEFLRERWKCLRQALGDDDVARSVVLEDPQLLTCETWRACRNRLRRTGVVMDDPDCEDGEGLIVRDDREEALRQRKEKNAAGPRVMEPTRAVKTHRGAAAVAAAKKTAGERKRASAAAP